MKKKIWIFALFCFLAVVALGSSLSLQVDETNTIRVYYLANENSSNKSAQLVYERRRVGDLSDEQRLSAALKLMRTPLDDQHTSVLPKTLFITGSFIMGNVATIDLTSKYGEMKPSKRIALTAAIAMSAFELDSIQTVKINAFGSARMPEEDTIFTRSSFLLDDSSAAIYSHSFDLYYIDMQIPNLALRSVTKKLASPILTANELMGVLLKSSDGQGLNLPFDGNLSLGSVHVNNKICYVDFRSIDIFDDVYLNYLSVYSIVNTVCSLEEVDCAVLTVNGFPLSKNGITFCDGLLTPVTSVVS